MVDWVQGAAAAFIFPVAAALSDPATTQLPPHKSHVQLAAATLRTWLAVLTRMPKKCQQFPACRQQKQVIRSHCTGGRSPRSLDKNEDCSPER